MHKLKLIASDLDGTLLLGGAQSLKDGTCDLIREMMDTGVEFAAASGRQYANLQQLFGPIKNDISYICENGGLVVCSNKIIYQKEMDRKLAVELIDGILAEDGCEVLVCTPHMQYIQPKNPKFYYHLRDVVRTRVECLTDVRTVSGPILKVSVYDETGLKNTGYWKEKYSGKCAVQVSGTEWLDMIPYGVNKAAAMEKLLEYLDISPEDCIAFGDHENDREMLSYVGCPIAMESGVKEVVALGTYTTDTVEHALQRIIAGEGYDW